MYFLMLFSELGYFPNIFSACSTSLMRTFRERVCSHAVQFRFSCISFSFFSLPNDCAALSVRSRFRTWIARRLAILESACRPSIHISDSAPSRPGSKSGVARARRISSGRRYPSYNIPAEYSRDKDPSCTAWCCERGCAWWSSLRSVPLRLYHMTLDLSRSTIVKRCFLQRIVARV